MSREAPPETIEKLMALCRQGQFAQAVEAGERLAQTYPGSFALWTILGGASLRIGQLDRAEAAFRSATGIEPAHAGAQYNLGLVLQAAGRLHEAKTAYARALRRDPGHIEAHINLGNVLIQLGQPEKAEQSYRQALALRPEDANTLSNLGGALRELGRQAEALEAWSRALQIAPDHDVARSQKLRLQWESCDFSAHNDFQAQAGRLGITGSAVPPFPFLSAEDDPARQRSRSDQWARQFMAQPGPNWTIPDARPAKLRIGYFSGCFHDHPTLRLMAGLLREHDRARFEVFVYSFGQQKTGDLRAWLSRTVDQFHDVEQLSPRQIATVARQHNLDIAIDLDGHTRQARAEVFAWRPAPITMSFLGYPGTTGAAFIDYLIADPVVIPDAERAHYSESVIYLPDTYQPNDDRRPVPQVTDTRADHGLPDEGFVFCCFNAARKIGPREFDLWMRLLGQVDGSVLWLLHAGPQMEANLRREADRRGVDPDRLIFADKVSQDRHLARQAHADLFLDTFHYNAHTTASDAIWAGLPVVTMAGRQFAARVAASLLSAAGLHDLVTDSAAEYERLALNLATDPARLARVRERVQTARQTSALFNTTRFARNFEAALDAAYEGHMRGQPPGDIRL